MNERVNLDMFYRCRCDAIGILIAGFIPSKVVSRGLGIAASLTLTIGGRNITINEYDEKRGSVSKVLVNDELWAITGTGSSTEDGKRYLHFTVKKDDSGKDHIDHYPDGEGGD